MRIRAESGAGTSPTWKAWSLFFLPRAVRPSSSSSNALTPSLLKQFSLGFCASQSSPEEQNEQDDTEEFIVSLKIVTTELHLKTRIQLLLSLRPSDSTVGVDSQRLSFTWGTGNSL